MKQDEITTHWRGGMAFETDYDGFAVFVDDKISGEHRLGPGPKKLMLVSLAGCTGMDVVSLLKKMRALTDHMEIHVAADQTDEHPIVYSKIYLTYKFTGKDFKKDKIEKAINLSQERYCGVSAMIRSHCPIDVIIEYVETT